MKTKPNLVLIIAGVAFVAILSLFIAEGSFSRIQRAPVRNVDFTEVILPVSKETAVKKIAAISIGIEGIDRGVTLKGKFADFWLADFHDPIFPEAYWLRANSQNNPALQRYADTSPASRKEDFYLFSPLKRL
jgi:hypothetical protein